MTTDIQLNCLHLFTKGLPEYEEKIIRATARFSSSRSIPISLVDEDKARCAEIIIIDGGNESSLIWAQENLFWLREKTIIWIDKRMQDLGQIMLKRPVLWVNLPIILSRILDDAETRKVSGLISTQKIGNKRVSETSKTKAHILICDDSEVVRSHLINILGQRGYVISAVDNGEAAIEAVQNQLFDCVLMDVLMPGMDGYRACRAILRKQSDKSRFPVIMLTSKTSPFDKIRGKMSGCSAYLTKPVAINDLLNTLERYAKKR